MVYSSAVIYRCCFHCLIWGEASEEIVRVLMQGQHDRQLDLRRIGKTESDSEIAETG